MKKAEISINIKNIKVKKEEIILRHAILVEGSGKDAQVLQETIKILDDEDIDFWIHWDKKFLKPVLKSNKSKIFFIKSTKNNWGAYTQIIVEKNLLKAVECKNYDYVHLISSSDIPLMTVDHFKNFFKKDVYIRFYKGKVDQEVLDRIKYYYPLNYIDLKKGPLKIKKALIIFLVIVQKFFKINRLKKIDFEIKKGSCQGRSKNVIKRRNKNV